ncbi:MAG TPA: hypothetical protein VFF30_05645, partial [Nitrososphaerales archaeon]|nr:hypothetical protein [Nitrososphaerales archaeon]
MTTQNSSSRKKDRNGAVRRGKNIGSGEFSASNYSENDETDSQKTAAEEEAEIQRKTVARTFRIYEELTTSFEKQV